MNANAIETAANVLRYVYGTGSVQIIGNRIRLASQTGLDKVTLRDRAAHHCRTAGIATMARLITAAPYVELDIRGAAE